MRLAESFCNIIRHNKAGINREIEEKQKMYDASQEKVYEHDRYSVIKRVTACGTMYSLVRAGSPFFIGTFVSLTSAIESADEAAVRERKGEHPYAKE